MLQAMFSGVSGLQAHQTELDVIGNNIANVSTIGFKSGTVTFESQLSQTLRASTGPTATSGGSDGSQVGLGVQLGAVNTLQTQGDLETTGVNTDLAIQGNGFFMVGNGSAVSYTRDGSFTLDSSGQLVNSNGNTLLGYLADDNGNVQTTQQVTSASALSVPIGTLTSVKQTSAATFQGNLDASSALQSTTAKITGDLDVSQAPPVLSTTVYDSQGVAHSVQVTLTNPVLGPAASTSVPAGAVQQWSVAVSIDGVVTTPPTEKIYAVPTATPGVDTYVFSTPGAVSGNPIGSTLQMTAPGSTTGTVVAKPFPLTIDFSGLSDASKVTATADGSNAPTTQVSTAMTLSGNLNLDNAPAAITTTVYTAAGAAQTLVTTLTPAATAVPPFSTPPAPAGATAAYDVKIQNTTAGTTLYDSKTNPAQSEAYYVPGTNGGAGSFVLTQQSSGNVTGSVISLDGTSVDNQGQQVVNGMNLSVDLSQLTTTTLASAADGQTGVAPTASAGVTVYDSLGVGHQINITYTRQLVGAGAPTGTAASWAWTATDSITGNVVGSSAQAGNSSLYFDSKGNLLNTNVQSVTVTPTNGAQPFKVTIDESALTQTAGSSSVAATTQDGFPVGTLQTFSIDQTGLITGIFSNGQSRSLGQIATASFSNPSGLNNIGGNLFEQSNNSGLAQIGQPNTAGRGNINTGFLEMSNVDLSTEFTNLITTQRGFQANTKIISTVDQMLQDVINLKQS